jgi:hypothetical protein
MMMMIGQSLVLVLFVFCLPRVETHPHVLIRNSRMDICMGEAYLLLGKASVVLP